MAASKEKVAQARVAFEAWAKSLQGQGDIVGRGDDALGRLASSQVVRWPTPAHWDDLNSDQQEVWIDVARSFDPTIAMICEQAVEGANASAVDSEGVLLAMIAADLKLPRMPVPYTMKTLVDAINGERKSADEEIDALTARIGGLT